MPGSRSRYRRRRARLRRWLARPTKPTPTPPPAPVTERAYRRDPLGNLRPCVTPTKTKPADDDDVDHRNLADRLFAAVLRSHHHKERIPDGEAAAVLCSGRGASGCGVVVYNFATLAEAIAANSAPCPNPRCTRSHVVAWRRNNKMHTRSQRMRQRTRAEEFRRAYPVPVNKGHAPPTETWETPPEFNQPHSPRQTEDTHD